MIGSAVFVAIFASFAIVPPDLCAEVYVDEAGSPYTDLAGRTLARYCEWTGPDAPVWDAAVCCAIDESGAGCSTPEPGGACPSGLERYRCEYGEADAAGGVTCYQPFPSACEAGLCVAATELPPPTQASIACCNEFVCQPIEPQEMWGCDDAGGYIFWCGIGRSNVDGTLSCFDDY